MAEYLIQGETLTGIADAIRGKTGGTEPVAVSDMAAQIEGIQAGGGDIGALIDRSITEIESNAGTVGNYAFASCSKLTSVNFPMATSIGGYAFNYCSGLINVNFPKAINIGDHAFYDCAKLTSVNFPAVTSIGSYAFDGCDSLTNVDFPVAITTGASSFTSCPKLTSVNFPMATSVGSYAFERCAKLTSVDFPAATSIGSSSFSRCSSLKAVILRNVDNICSVYNAQAFGSTPIASGTGYIYVPSALIEQYKVATNWSTYATQFRALEDYTVDGTVTGELDPAKTGT